MPDAGPVQVVIDADIVHGHRSFFLFVQLSFSFFLNAAILDNEKICQNTGEQTGPYFIKYT